MIKKIVVIMAACLVFSQVVFADAVVSVDKSGESTKKEATAASTQSNELASPVSTMINSRTRLRKTPNKSGIAYRMLEKGEKVSVLGASEGWVKVETKHKFESGEFMTGYVWGGNIPEDTARNVGATDKPKVQLVVSSKQSITPQAGTRVVAVSQPAKVVDVKPLEDARDFFASRVKKLETENLGLKADLTKKSEELNKKSEELLKRSSELKAVQVALADASSRATRAELAATKSESEKKALTSQIVSVKAELQTLLAGGDVKLLAMADTGEAVFFKEIGEANMAGSDGKTVLRFPLSASNKADAVLNGAKAEKRIRGAFVYYILDSKALAF